MKLRSNVSTCGICKTNSGEAPIPRRDHLRERPVARLTPHSRGWCPRMDDGPIPAPRRQHWRLRRRRSSEPRPGFPAPAEGVIRHDRSAPYLYGAHERELPSFPIAIWCRATRRCRRTPAHGRFLISSARLAKGKSR